MQRARAWPSTHVVNGGAGLASQDSAGMGIWEEVKTDLGSLGAAQDFSIQAGKAEVTDVGGD